MPAPASVDELLDLVQKSGVADEAKLKAYVAKTAGAGGFPPEPNKAAGLLVRDGILTYFQAEQLLQGKWKRFSIGKYKVLERLGAGGMGQVFLCEHKLMRRRVAVKVLPTAKAADEASLGRFYREARAVAAVDHPNIVRAYDIDQDDNLHFLVMEYVDGINFQDLIKKHGQLDILRACHYVYGSAVGLQHAHEIGLVHRDIKPGNILLDRSGVVKILDLGLARFFHDDADNLTKQYDENILGTADYLSPEQAEDSHAVDIRTDIYSLGATFYFLLTGSPPFPEGTIPQKLIWHKSREPQPVTALRPDAPPDVVAVVKKMMAKNPADRYQTPAEVMAALAPWAAMPIAPPPEKEMPQLSPAVLGGASGGRGPSAAAVAAAAQRSMTTSYPVAGGGPGSGSGSGVRVSSSPSMAASGSGGGGRTPAPGTLPPIPTGAANGVWDSLGDAPAASGEDTARPARTPEPAKPRPAKPPAPARARRPARPLVLAAVGLLLLAGAGVGAYALFFAKRDTVDPGGDPTHPAGKRLLVSKATAGAENTFSSLQAAIRAAAPGDTIAIQEPMLSEPAFKLSRQVTKGDITIESGLPGGKAAVIEFSSVVSGAGGTDPVPMVEVGGVENVRFRNVEFDGKGVADFAVKVNGNAPGVTFEGVTVRNVKKAAFYLYNTAAPAGRPVTLDRVRVLISAANDAAVKIEAGGTLQSRNIVVRNSRFEGPGQKVAVRVDGPVVDLEIAGNRVYRVETAFAFGKPPEGQPVRAQITQNTVVDTRAGVVFNGPGKFEVAVARNYFARTEAAVRADGGAVAGATYADNGCDPQTQPGVVPPANLTRFDAPQLSNPNPDDDATFLHFPGGSGPVIGAVRVGAN